MNGFLRLFDSVRTSGDGKLTFQFVLWTLIFGVIISWIIIFYNKKIIGAFVRAIISSGATSEETAKTLAEIEQDYNVSAISHYKRSAALQRIIFIAGAQEAPKRKADLRRGAPLSASSDALCNRLYAKSRFITAFYNGVYSISIPQKSHNSRFS